MQRTAIDAYNFNTKVFHLFNKQWMLLTAGDFSTGHFNSMTVSWGGLGYMWGRSYVQVVVRPQRYTFEFMERYDTFTLCAFPADYHKTLSVLGTKSGREMDKIKSSGLTPLPSGCVAAPGYDEAELIFECRKIYSQDFDPDRFIDSEIDRNYPIRDYHRMYMGEIMAIQGSEKFHV